jgi:hypothetical protein
MSDKFLAMVVMERPVELEYTSVVTRLRELFPGVSPDFKASLPNGAIILDVNRLPIALMNIGTPIPPGTLDQATTNNHIWPESAVIMSRQRAHFIVSNLLKPEGLSGSVQAAESVTQVCAAIASLVQALGVYWVPSEAVYQTDMFVSAANNKNQMPFLWIRHHFSIENSAEDTLTGCVTTGLSKFVGREIEFASSNLPPQVIAHRTSVIAEYILSQRGI